QAATADSNETWLASYLAGQKVGYSVFREGRHGNGFVFSSLSRLTVSMMGRTQFMRVRSSARTGSDLTLQSFEFELSSQDGAYSGSGRAKGREFRFKGGRPAREKVIRLAEALYPVEALGRLVSERSPEPGSRMSFLVFDGAVMDTMRAEVAVEGREKLDGTEALRVLVRRAGLDATVWIDGAGRTLKEETPLGLNSRRVSQAQALAGEDEAGRLDVLKLFRVEVETLIAEPARVSRVVLELDGVDTAQYMLDGATQKVTSQEPLQVEIVKAELPSAPVSLPVKGQDEFLKPTLSVQSDDPAVAARAREIVAGGKDGVVAVGRLFNWVYASLGKEATASFPNARDVLRSMKGDCNEHAVLIAALCRAAGVPAKVVVGLVYMDGAFYYHAWNEVFLGRWIPIDATLGELPASALRLRLVEGEMASQAQVLGVVRKIGIRIVSFE
ncbi:MAG: transglutaminase-like domain-containing protein, partial [candidate division WOR-3 bacterium]